LPTFRRDAVKALRTAAGKNNFPSSVAAFETTIARDVAERSHRIIRTVRYMELSADRFAIRWIYDSSLLWYSRPR
jgi:hypothetical protein